MKKVLSLVVLGGMFAFYACGPSAEEKAKMEQAKQDSIAAVEASNKAASEAAAQQAMMQAKADSTAKADSVAKAAVMTKAPKGKKK
jgi:uncharacterized protein (DUF2147 family)